MKNSHDHKVTFKGQNKTLMCTDFTVEEVMCKVISENTDSKKLLNVNIIVFSNKKWIKQKDIPPQCDDGQKETGLVIRRRWS